MIKEKMRDIISVCAIIIVMILSVILFEVRSQTGFSYNNEYFSKEDIYNDWNEVRTHHIDLTDCRDSLTIEDGGYYELSGSLNGQVIVSGNSQNVYFIRLNGVDITNDTGACILIEKANKVVLELKDGTKNLLNMGQDSDDESIDGAIYSKADLTVRGSGGLDITANYRHGIVCNDKLVFTGGNICINAKEDGVHANDLIAIRDVVMDITAGDDGLTVKNDDEAGVFFGESGEILVRTCYEGIEGDEVIIESGKYTLYPVDDGINAMTMIDIRGGDIRIENSEGRDADGIDSNKDVLVSGGNIYISLPQGAMNMPIDYGQESGGKLNFTGGDIEAYVGGEEIDAIERAAQGMGGGFRGGGGVRPDRRSFEGGTRGTDAGGFKRSTQDADAKEFGGGAQGTDATSSATASQGADSDGFKDGTPGADATSSATTSQGADANGLGGRTKRPDFFDETDPANQPPSMDRGDFAGRTEGSPGDDAPVQPPFMDRGDFTGRTMDGARGEARGFAPAEARNNTGAVLAFLGFSALALVLAFILALIIRSRVNIR